MKLLKVKNGLMETENFFLVSPFNDFAGPTNVNRDISTGKLKIISNSKIERKFNYNEFVIEAEKSNFESMDISDYSMIYLGNEKYMFGIKDKQKDKQSRYWKILKQEDHIQAYSSPDGIEYTNIGGMEFTEPLTNQGFMKHSDQDFILNSYRVYDSPFITIQNFPEHTLCEMYDSSNKLLKIRLFNSDMECKIFLDSNNIEGHFVFKDTEGKIIYTTDNIICGYGDVWVCSPYDLEIIYLGNQVTNTNPALLQGLDELISIKNIGKDSYSNVIISTQTQGNDLIQLSLDGITFTNTITLSILPAEQKNIFLRITRNADNHNFKVRDFQLIINE